MINEAGHVSKSSADLELLGSSVNLSDINRHWQRRSQTFRGNSAGCPKCEVIYLETTGSCNGPML